ncbi:MAG TPA: cupin domain-containing protein [Candidatus Eremiobacteraceae bacterium]|nr:cupin domain-containing protein [Candidatus Eremiobacteraceae bacterium]
MSWIIGPSDAAAKPRPSDNLATPIVDRYGVEVEYYAPRGVDPQTPHDCDELYVVATGTASFASPEGRQSVAAGDLIFVPAGEAHRFEDIGETFAVWVFFFGPPSGGASGHG